MIRRILSLALMTIVLSAAVTQPAWAQGNGQGNGNGGQAGNSEGKGNSDNAGSSNAGGANANSSNAPAKADEDLALEALRAEDAVSLKQILASVRRDEPGRVIDAQLLSLDGVLVYEVKVLSQDGRVSRIYYDAGSGRQLSQD